MRACISLLRLFFMSAIFFAAALFATYFAAPRALAKPGDLLFTIEAPNSTPLTRFGSSFDLRDGKLLVGEEWRHIGSEVSAGSAYLFDAASGALIHTIRPPVPTDRENFGKSVAFVGDRAVIASDREVFTYDVESGALDLVITDPEPEPFGIFASDIADFNGRIAVAAPSQEDAGLRNNGVIYVLDVNSGDVGMRISNPHPWQHGTFGSGINPIDSTQSALFVGQSGYTEGPDGDEDGAVYRLNGLTGEVEYRVSNPNYDPENDVIDDRFGESIALSANQILISARLEDSSGARDSGAVYVADAETGDIVGELINPEIDPWDGFGNFVADADGDFLVGAWGDSVEDVERAGTVYLFDGETHKVILEIPNPNPQRSAYFGNWFGFHDNRIYITGRENGVDLIHVFQGIPEPSSVALVLISVFVLSFLHWRRCGKL